MPRPRHGLTAMGWTIHSEHHWSRTLLGRQLDYWPGRSKFMYAGRIMTGDVYAFIASTEQRSRKSSR